VTASCVEEESKDNFDNPFETSSRDSDNHFVEEDNSQPVASPLGTMASRDSGISFDGDDRNPF